MLSISELPHNLLPHATMMPHGLFAVRAQAEAEQTLASDRARSAAAVSALEVRLAAAEAERREFAISLDAEAASRAAAEVLVANLKAQVAQLQAWPSSLPSDH